MHQRQIIATLRNAPTDASPPALAPDVSTSPTTAEQQRDPLPAVPLSNQVVIETPPVLSPAAAAQNSSPTAGAVIEAVQQEIAQLQAQVRPGETQDAQASSPVAEPENLTSAYFGPGLWQGESARKQFMQGELPESTNHIKMVLGPTHLEEMPFYSLHTKYEGGAYYYRGFVPLEWSSDEYWFLIFTFDRSGLKAEYFAAKKNSPGDFSGARVIYRPTRIR